MRGTTGGIAAWGEEQASLVTPSVAPAAWLMQHSWKPPAVSLRGVTGRVYMPKPSPWRFFYGSTLNHETPIETLFCQAEIELKSR